MSNSIITLYRNFVLEHVREIGSIESLVRTLLFFLPGSTRDSELKVEAAYTATGLFALVNDIVVLQFVKKQLTGVAGTKVPEIDKTGQWLAVLQHMTLLLEIFAHQTFGEKSKWRVVFVLECIKGLFKLKLLGDLKGSTLTISKYTVPQYRDVAAEIIAKRGTDNTLTPTLRPHRSNIPLSWDSVNSGAVIRKPSFQETLNELVYILRPIIYVAGIMRFGNHSWKPWLLSLAIEASSVIYYLQKMRKGVLTQAQEQEATRRMTVLGMYVMRSPFFELMAQSSLSTVLTKIRNLPLLGVVVSAVTEYVGLYRKYYFYISGT